MRLFVFVQIVDKLVLFVHRVGQVCLRNRGSVSLCSVELYKYHVRPVRRQTRDDGAYLQIVAAHLRLGQIEIQRPDVGAQRRHVGGRTRRLQRRGGVRRLARTQPAALRRAAAFVAHKILANAGHSRCTEYKTTCACNLLECMHVTGNDYKM